MDTDGTTLTAFAAQHSVGLTRFAYVLTGDRQLAEDLVQDCFLALHRRFGETLPLEAPVAYARKVIANGQTSRMRRMASAETVLDELPDAGVDGADLSEQDAAWRMLATLPDRQRAVLVLRYYVDLPDDEIARMLDCRVGTVRSLAARAFAALRQHPVLAADVEGSQS
ncbi:MAG TPA: SigE family RNA polymerase sigma factor [Jatrophihabitantaceae bacterium]